LVNISVWEKEVRELGVRDEEEAGAEVRRCPAERLICFLLCSPAPGAPGAFSFFSASPASPAPLLSRQITELSTGSR